MPDEEPSPKAASRASADALLQNEDWGRLHARLLAFATTRVKTRAAAEDLVQEATRRVLDANWEPWDPAKNPDLFRFLTGIINRLLHNERTSARAHREIVMDREAREGSRELRTAYTAEKVGDGVSSAEARLGAHELLRARTTRLRTYIAKDEIACALVDQIEQGNDSAREQAEATGFPIERIYEARRRLAQWVARVTRELPAGEPKDEETP